MEREVRRHYEKVIWEIIMPKKNPQDLTLRNLRALKKRVDKMQKKLRILSRFYDKFIFGKWRI